MSRNPAFMPVFDMESDVKDVRRWALVLGALAESNSAVEPELIHVISNVLFKIGQRIEAQWNEAFDAVREQS